MNYSEPLITQVVIFCRGIGCGVLLGAFYDAVSAVRMLFSERKSVYVFFDTLYFLFAALISFFFMVLYNSGQVRLNLMAAELFGGMAFHFSLGRYVLGRYASELLKIRKILSFFISPFRKSAKRFRDFSERLFIGVRKKLSEGENKEKFRKKIQ
ncbi:MAG: spore cortex biosynthesis protein YabQ [Clostridia bacterium]|nr:spore cortex biosynthesis protein YabQ [Clostridia bacterium]